MPNLRTAQTPTALYLEGGGVNKTFYEKLITGKLELRTGTPTIIIGRFGGCLVKQIETHVQGDVPIHVPGVVQILGAVPITFRGLCQALCSVIQRGQLFILTNDCH